MKKIKGSNKKLEPMLIISVAAISLIALIPLRMYQVLTLIESDTGFFKGSNASIPVFYVILGLVIAAVLVMSYLSEKAGRTRDCRVKSIPLGVVSMLCATAVVYESVRNLFECSAIEGSFIGYIGGPSLMSYLMKSGAAPLFFEAVFGFFTAAFFFIYAINCFNKSINLNAFRYLSVTPVLWSICRIIFLFLCKISFVNISDLLLELIMLVFLISFTMSFAQVVTNVSPEVAAWRLYGCGVCAAIIGIVLSLTRLIMLVCGKGEMLVEGYGFSPADLAVSVFIPLFLINSARAKKQNNLQ